MNDTMSRRDRKKICIQNTLVERSMQLFVEKGFEETTIADITKAADLGTGTFYNYFESKEAIIQYVLMQKFSEAQKPLEKLMQAEKKSSREKISIILEILGTIYDNNRPLFELCVKHLGFKRPPHGPGFKSILCHIIEDGQEKGEFKKGIPTEMIIETFMGLIKSAATSQASLSFKENLAYKLELFLYGLTDSPAIK